MRSLLVLAALLSGCSKQTAPSSAEAAVPAARAEKGPALAVLIVVDQLPVRLLETPRERYSAGLARLTGPDAAVFTGHYAHAITYTCPGHATISTGASPSVTGIVSNHWYRPPKGDAPGETVYCAERGFLRVDTLADRVGAAGGKVASVALKDRAAIMLGGGAELVSWYDRTAGVFTGPLGAVPIAPHLKEWTALFPEDYERWVGPDAGPREADPRIGTTFPHPAPGPGELLYTPHAGDALVDAALAATDALALGTHDEPDLLTLSFSQTDYIGHAFTSESWEAMDGMIRLDRSIGRLLEGLEQRVGEGRLTVFLTSDHGASKAEGLVRVPYNAVPEAADAALVALGIDRPSMFEAPSLWLPPIEDPELAAEAARAVAKAVAGIEGIEAAYPWRLDPVDGPHAQAIRFSLDPERSGDVYVLRGAGALFDYSGSEGLGTSHGTPFAFDTDVPILAWGVGVRAGAKGDADVRQVAPTLAKLLGIEPPAAADQPAIDALLR